MVYYPDIPSAPNKVQGDLDKMRANFQHLGPLAGSVADLEDVSVLAPHVGEILDSRIVDHNLDVTDPPNGFYVRFASGLQLCWHRIPSVVSTEEGRFRPVWVYPATFTVVPYADLILPFGTIDNWIGFSRHGVTQWGSHPRRIRTDSAEFVIFYDGQSGAEVQDLDVFAIGVA